MVIKKQDCHKTRNWRYFDESYIFVLKNPLLFRFLIKFQRNIKVNYFIDKIIKQNTIKKTTHPALGDWTRVAWVQDHYSKVSARRSFASGFWIPKSRECVDWFFNKFHILYQFERLDRIITSYNFRWKKNVCVSFRWRPEVTTDIWICKEHCS